jgi:hypothetical protein
MFHECISNYNSQLSDYPHNFFVTPPLAIKYFLSLNILTLTIQPCSFSDLLDE